MKRALLLFLAALACAVTVSTLVCTSKAVATGPAAAARAFLVDSTLDRNGFEACNYLASSEQRAVSAAGAGESCRQAVDTGSGVLDVGRMQIASLGQLKQLKARERVQGGRALVQLSSGGASVSFELVRANASEKEEFRAPKTGWRIVAGPGLPAPRGAGSSSGPSV